MLMLTYFIMRLKLGGRSVHNRKNIQIQKIILRVLRSLVNKMENKTMIFFFKKATNLFQVKEHANTNKYNNQSHITFGYIHSNMII